MINGPTNVKNAMTLPLNGASIVFDLDGTLVDTAFDLTAALNHVLAERGRPTVPPHTVRMLVGHGARVLIEKGFAATGAPLPPDALAPELERFLIYYRSHIADESRPFPGAVAALERLSAQGARLGVCTNKPLSLSQALLDALDLTRLLPVVIGADSLPVKKPDPLPLQEAVRRLGGELKSSILIGDSPTDIATARAANVKVIAVSFGYTTVAPAELGADILIDHFDALDAALEELLAAGA